MAQINIKKGSVSSETAIRPNLKFQQIFDTVNFEFIRNKMKFLILIVVDLVFFGLGFAIQQINENRGRPLPPLASSYITSYLTLIDFVILIAGCSLAGAIISRDYKDRTGNLLFPKITKERLLTGRIIASSIMLAIIVMFYYALIALVTMIKYDSFPSELFLKSMGWAIFYGIAILSFVTFWSSFMKSPSLAIITSLLTVWLLFSMIEGILSITVDTEPIFLLNYYSRIISAVFNMPEVRYYEQIIPVSETQEFSMINWITPNQTGALVGLLTYTFVFYLAAFLMFKRRQFKN